MKVMTFNIWNYNPPWPLRRRLIAELIQAHQPDVVALQETRHDFRFERGKGQGEQLAEMTGYLPTSAIGQVYVPVARVDEGLTILTRQPPDRTMECRLTMYPRERADQNQRLILGVTVEVGGRLVDVYDTHFSLSPPARGRNAHEAADFINQESAARPIILMGDLNAGPDEPSIQFLTAPQPQSGERGNFTDAWAAANPDQPGYTYASFDPVKRIDYVLVRNIGRVQRAIVVGQDDVDGVYPSDHLGIVVDVDV